MTDEITRREFESLQNRVAELESQLENNNSTHNRDDDMPPGLDHRDMAVLDLMRRSGVRSGYSLVRAYQSATDITKKNTAKQRAKMLEQRQEYEALL